jgi:Lon protease-like protein
MELPIFPLRVVLFPGRPLPVHVFEDRYRQMLTEVLEADRRFGIVAIRAGAAEDPAPSAFEVGCVSEVEQVTWLPHGRADVVARGVQRFRVQRWLEPAPYHRAEISPLADGDEIADPAKLAALRELLVPYLQALGAPDELASQLPDSPDHLAWLAAAAAQVGLEEQQSLLEQDSTTARIDDTVTLLRRETGLIRHFGSVGSLRPPGPNGAELN